MAYFPIDQQKKRLKKNQSLRESSHFHNTTQDDRRRKSESHVLTMTRKTQLNHINFFLSLKVDTASPLYGVDQTLQ
jgi:hypothetical protein